VGLVTGDSGALQEVVWALLAHAVEVSEPGARVEVGLERSGNEVLLAVTDTSGLPPPETVREVAPAEADMPAVVQRFEPGTLREIVEEYHGRLDVLQTPT